MQNGLFEFDKSKNDILKRERGIGFDDIITLIEAGYVLAILEHPNRKKYPGQFIYEIDVDGYVHVVPFVIRDKTIFLKTIYPSRKASKNYKKRS